MTARPKKGSKKRISVASAKSKGRELQKWTCEKISNLLNLPWGKDEMIASREMGQSGVDVRLIGEALQQFPFSVECKRSEKWDVPGFIRQAKTNQLPNTNWLLIMRRNREEPIAVLDAEVFFKLCKGGICEIVDRSANEM